MSDRRKYWAKQLEDCINNKNKHALHGILSEAIKFKTKVKISFEYSYKCSAHKVYFPKESNYFPLENIDDVRQIPCPENHYVCLKCLESYFRPLFEKHLSEYSWECPGCLALNIQGSYLGSYLENCEDLISEVLGEDFVSEKTQEVESRTLSINTHSTVKCHFSESANCSSLELHQTCTHNHKVCKDCITTYLQSKVDTNKIRCPSENCQKYFLHQTIRAALDGNGYLLEKFWDTLNLPGRKKLVCLGCNKKFDTDAESELAMCSCGNTMCSRCGTQSHPGATCLESFRNTREYQMIELFEDSTNPELRDQYNRAVFGFEKFVGGGRKLLKAELVVNPELQRRYNLKKQELDQKAGENTEMTCWHGSNSQNYPLICKGGFKIGGIDGHQIACGKAHGYGLYTGIQPDTSINYVRGNQQVLLCRGIRGIAGTRPANSPQDLNNPSQHCYMPSNSMCIFFSPDQVLPEFLVTYN